MTDVDVITEDDRKKYGGRWVAVRDKRVLVAADRPDEVISWLRTNHADAALIFRLAAEGEPTVWRL